MFHSLGMFVVANGTLRDVRVNSIAYDAGAGPSRQADEGEWATVLLGRLEKIIRQAKPTNTPIIFVTERDGESATYFIDYQGGESYASLKRHT